MKITIKNMLLLLCVAVLVEICLFNFRSIQSLFYEEHSWEEYTVEYSGADIYGDGIIGIQDEIAVISIQDIGLDVKNIRLDLEPLDSIDLYYMESGLCYADIDVLDEGNRECMYSFIRNWPVLPENLTSQFIWMQLMGEVYHLNVGIDMPAGHLFRINGITFNAKKPLDFSAVRFLAVWLVFLLCYGLRRKSDWWREDCLQMTFGKKSVLGIIFSVFFGVSYFLMASNPTIINDCYNPYQELAWALDAGQASLLEPPPQDLGSMKNPYDYSERYVAGLEYGLEYKYDFAYYDGAYYIYHGILPCLLFYLPVYHFTGLNMPNSIPVFFCCLLFGIGLVCLMRQIIIRYFPKTPFALFVMITLTGLFGCQLPFFITQPHSYHLTVICAVMLVVWGLYFWMSSLKTEERSDSLWRIFMGSFCMALVAASRPTLLLYSILAFSIFGRAWLTDKEGYDKRSRIIRMVSFVIPYVIVAIPVMYYNYIRFGSVFDFGFHYNLTNMDARSIPFSLDKITAAVYGFLIKLPDMCYRFPYLVQPYRELWDNNHVFIAWDTLFGSLFFFNSFLLAIVVVFAKSKEFCKKRLFAFSVMLLGFGIFLMILDVEMTGCVIYRYQADFTFALFITAWVGILWLQEVYTGKPQHDIFRRILIVVVFLSVIMNAMLWFVPEYFYLREIMHYWSFSLAKGNTKLYYDLYYGFNFW